MIEKTNVGQMDILSIIRGHMVLIKSVQYQHAFLQLIRNTLYIVKGHRVIEQIINMLITFSHSALSKNVAHFSKYTFIFIHTQLLIF